jgi:hypothetical protein
VQATRRQPLDLYVALVVTLGVACAALVLGTGYDTLQRLLEPELALFALCALAGELVPPRTRLDPHGDARHGYIQVLIHTSRSTPDPPHGHVCSVRRRGADLRQPHPDRAFELPSCAECAAAWSRADEHATCRERLTLSRLEGWRAWTSPR